MKRRLILIAGLVPLLLAGCGQTDGRMQAAGQRIGQSQAESLLPAQPDDCRQLSRSGVRAGDRLDVALLKADAALARQNGRTAYCAAWFDRLRAGLVRN